jgi:hypothetical protein
MNKNNPRDIGFLGPKFLGLGLFSELPDPVDREQFRAWLVENGEEHGADWYQLKHRAGWAIHRAYARNAKEENKHT